MLVEIGALRAENELRGSSARNRGRTCWNHRQESGELGLNGLPLPTEQELTEQDRWLDNNWPVLEFTESTPHYHACRPFDRARKHTNDWPCFDDDAKPEKQHEGFMHICGRCDRELERRFPVPDDGHDDPRYGGY